MDIDQTQDCCFTHEENWFRYRVGAIILEENSVQWRQRRLRLLSSAAAFIGRTAEEAVRREVLEETGLPYEIDRLAFVHETFLRREGSIAGLHCHELSFYFLMKPMGKREITKRGQCIDGEERACWLPVDRLSGYTVYPLFYAEWLPHLPTGNRPHRHRPPPEIGAENFRQNPMDKLTLGRFFVTIIAQKTNVSVHGR